jgi:CRISPR-associated protein Cas1
MMTDHPDLPKLKPIPIKERVSLFFVSPGHVDIQDGAFVIIDKQGVRKQLPVGGVACLLLEPGTRISHAAVAMAAKVGTLLLWVGQGGTRLYAAGQPGGARSDRLLYQAQLALDDQARLKVVRKMYALRFEEEAPSRRSIEQIRGIEGNRVKETYKLLAKQYKVKWNGRKYDPQNWMLGDLPNQCISAATAALYGITEAAVLAAGYTPGIGFIHTGKPLSFVYDIADIVKFKEVVPLAFKIASQNPTHPEREVRRACRDVFRTSRLLNDLIPLIETVLAAGELTLPKPAPEQILPAILNPKGIGDVGHRT